MKVTEILWNNGSVAAEIDVVLANQDTIHASITTHVFGMTTSIFIAMERISLKPFGIRSIAKIDVISAALFSTSATIWHLLGESWVRAICLKVKRFGYPHCVNQMSASANTLAITAATDDPVIDFCSLANGRFAGGKRAVPVKRVGCKAAIVAYYVRI